MNFRGLRDGIDELMREERKALIIFPVTVLIIATITHEIFHMIVLNIYHCPFTSSIQIIPFDFIYMINTSCDVTKLQAVNILAAGLVGNLLLGVILAMISSLIRLKGYFLKSFYISTASLGFFFSTGFYLLGAKGDAVNITKILGLNVDFLWIAITGIFIIVLSTIEFWIEFNSMSKEYELLHMLKEEERELKISRLK
ncbi:MAG: hypothetical protein J7L45_01715 [Candidatus Aenigmarchaeota archaeon]|nr:hypothetical protein [Candidatus Aenigmarchaeota archaeon]